MRILFIDFTLPYLLADATYAVGGWAVQLSSWIKGLTANSHQVGVLTWKGANKFVNKTLDIELIETYDPNKGIKILKYFYDYIPISYKKALQFKPDVIIQACAGLNTGIMAFVADRINIPFVYRVANDIDVDFRYKDNLLLYEQLAYKYGLRRSKMILCQNQYQYDCIKRNYPDKRVKIIHNPFHFVIDMPEINSRKDRSYLAWIGNFRKQKNLGQLYNIAKSLPKVDIKIGGMPSKLIDNETLIAVENLKKLKNVEFVGYMSRRDVLNFLNKAIVLLNTSCHEGFSNTFLEALSVGTPIVAPRRVDPDLIVTKHGLGFTAFNDNELSNMVEQIISLDLNEYNNLSLNCKKYIEKHHASEVKACELTSSIESIIEKKR
jgi:glycosyltransferase involved in cell wall biosynthesis